MTKITLSSNASGTGNVNFAAPNTNSAITVTLPTSNVDMDALGPSTDANAVGTYGAFRNSTASNFYPGDTFSGSDLAWTNFYGAGSTYSGITPAGTWRIMGFSQSFANGSQSTLYVRIS